MIIPITVHRDISLCGHCVYYELYCGIVHEVCNRGVKSWTVLAAPWSQRWLHWSCWVRQQATPVAGGQAGRDAILCRLPTY